MKYEAEYTKSKNLGKLILRMNETDKHWIKSKIFDTALHIRPKLWGMTLTYLKVWLWIMWKSLGYDVIASIFI